MKSKAFGQFGCIYLLDVEEGFVAGLVHELEVRYQGPLSEVFDVLVLGADGLQRRFYPEILLWVLLDFVDVHILALELIHELGL